MAHMDEYIYYSAQRDQLYTSYLPPYFFVGCYGVYYIGDI